MKLLRILAAIFLPPLGVFLTLGISPAFFINVGLTLLGYVPGIIHALWVVLKTYEHEAIDRKAYENAVDQTSP
ncbi:YqaE/Pmp3 family membrane protein [Stenomitos frigidus]|uniref:YqaE/Pmp3 family membrane protein n=1 Tax=Stenomitos frigidus ULC18 TaxID=2107698 RepID=A0A2T1ECJ7_9CYAN|nr:YqaE/Pmp3 family membrane protein [Stenomitos frigidus]PSB30431.1 YqaE/Pmp3 family membrane protein [Stenomitos frigidus ULC18]